MALIKAKLIAQGAESKLWLVNDVVIKERFSKSYRIKQLDVKLRRFRTKREAKALRKAGKLINVPKVLEVSDYSIKMAYINGEVLRDVISKVSDELIKKVGHHIALLHNEGIIHGDLTTSNMIINDDELFFIDFGLSEFNGSIEAKAVDLHLLREALRAKHFKVFNHVWNLIKNAYLKECLDGDLIINRLSIVEKRGKYKH